MQTDHTMITAISAVPTSALAYLSADRSGKIYIWNVKSPSPRPVVVLIPAPNATTSSPNAGVITCLDTLDPNFVLAGTYGQGVSVWDLRYSPLCQAQPDCSEFSSRRGPNRVKKNSQ